MSFHNQSVKIRSRLEKFTTQSLFMKLLVWLHKSSERRTSVSNCPWLICLALEWVLEVKPVRTARDASERDIHQILNRMWALQNEALSLSEDRNPFLELRPFILQQARFQNNQIVHAYFLVRLYTIIEKCSQSNRIQRSFERQTGIQFKQFVILSVYFYTCFSRELPTQKNYITYEQICRDLVPAFGLSIIKKYLALLGEKTANLKSKFEGRANARNFIKPEDYFDEPHLLETPLILAEFGVTTAHTYVATIGITEFMLRTLKASDQNGRNFRIKFTNAYEEYLAVILDEFGQEFDREDHLKEVYNEHQVTGKVVDYLIAHSNKSLFIEAKGVEPKRQLMVTSRQNLIRDKLREHLFQGVKQASECASILESIGYKDIGEKNDRYALIVTHQDFFFGDAIRLKDYLGEDYSQEVNDLVGEHLSLEKVFFVSVDDFEGILDVCMQSNSKIVDFLDFWIECRDDRNAGKLFARDYISEFGKNHKLENPTPIGSELLRESFKELAGELEIKIEESSNYWTSQGKFSPIVGAQKFWTYFRELKSYLT